MTNGRKILIVALAVIVLLWIGSAVSRRVTAPVSASNNDVIFTQTYHLADTLDDALVVIAETVELSGESHVRDDAALVGRQQVTLDGHIDGDLAALGGDVRLGQNAQIAGEAVMLGNRVVLSGQVAGDLTVIADTLTINPGTRVSGDFTACVSHLTDERADGAPIQKCSEGEAAQLSALQSLRNGKISLDGFGSGGFSTGGFVFSLFGSLTLTGLAALAVTLFPRQFSYLTDAVRVLPRRMARTGCLTLLAALGIGVALIVVLASVPVVGLLLLPFGLLAGLLLFGMTLTGWIALALLLGSGIARRAGGKNLPPLVTVAFGSLLLFVFWHILAFLPFGALIEFVLMAAFGCVGLGAAFATRLGTRPIQRRYFVQG